MNELLTFMYICIVIFVMAWVTQLGAHPNSARTTLAAIVMTVCTMLVVGCAVLSILNLLLRALM